MRQALKKTFIQLYSTTPLNKISIQAIVDGACASRGSFYYHFRDVYDLLESCEREIIDGINRTVQDDNLFRHIRDKSPGDLSVAADLYTSTLRFMAQHRFEILTLDRGSNGRSFTMKLVGMTRDNLTLAFNTFSPLDFDPIQKRNMVEYMSAGCVAMYMRWLADDMPIPPEQMSKVMVDAMAKLISRPLL